MFRPSSTLGLTALFPLSDTSLEVASLIDHNPSQFDGENLNIDTPPLPGDFLPNPASKLSSQVLQCDSPHLGLLAEHNSLPTILESYNNSNPPQTLEESDPPETDALLPPSSKGANPPVVQVDTITTSSLCQVAPPTKRNKPSATCTPHIVLTYQPIKLPPCPCPFL